MSNQDARIRALRRVIGEARNAPAPELDWDKLEEGVLARIGAAPPRSATPWGRVALVAAAAAAVFAVGIGLRAQHHVETPVAQTSSSHVFGPGVATLDGSRLAAGDRVVADAHAIAVTEPGQAVWTLAAHSTATMADTGRYMTVRLDTGSVTVAVVPHHAPESFAIEVEQTRVAAHGTHFTVERVGNQAHVVLDEGVVAVGAAADRGRTHGFVMKAPSTGTFSLDGARTGEIRAPAAAAEPREPTAAAEPTAPAPKRAAPPTPVAPTAEDKGQPLPASPDDRDAEQGATKVMALVEKCFVDNTTSAGGVSIRVRSNLGFTVTPAGKVTKLVADPPLAPAVQQCSDHAVDTRLFARSRDGVQLTRTLHLAR